jgi:hypothetical protein
VHGCVVGIGRELSQQSFLFGPKACVFTFRSAEPPQPAPTGNRCR